MRRTLLAILTVATSACARADAPGTVASAVPPPAPAVAPRRPPAPPPAPPAPPAPAHELAATLERGPCLGWCPVYKVAIFRDGLVEYHGDHYVQQHGDATGHVTPAQLAALDRLFADAHYFDLADHYTHVTVTDGPTAVTSYQLAGQKKQIQHYLGDEDAPPALTTLEKGIDHVVGIEHWIGSDDARMKNHEAWR